MSYKRKTQNKKFHNGDSVTENEHLASILSIVNGYCKINLVVPQIKLFYSSDSVLPINAKVNSVVSNNKNIQKQVNNTPDGVVDMFKNTLNLRNNKDMENLNKKQSSLDNDDFVDFDSYTKPLYYNNNDQIEKHENNKRSISPKSKKKKNKANKMDTSTSGIRNFVPSTQTNLNKSNNGTNDNENGILSELHNSPSKEHRRKQICNGRFSINNTLQSRSRISFMEQNLRGTENNLLSESECPICYKTFTSSYIEFHASGCTG